MANVGTIANPLRVAIVGAGPAGFYTAEHLLKNKEITVEIDLFDRLVTPFGLVRHGVAPDHQKIKNVTKAYDRQAKNPQMRYYGNVMYGQDISLADLKRFYHQVCFTTGASSDRKLNIPGEDLMGSVPATEFVAWYNGHPDYRHYQFDLSQESVAVVGVGNVAVDVARILCRTPEELASTDMADHALKVLQHSRVKKVYLLGRRGPAQAAFTNPEIREMGELAGADLIVSPEEVILDPLSQRFLDEDADKLTIKKVKMLQDFAQLKPQGKEKQLIMRFLTSPVALLGDELGCVESMTLVKNELYKADDGSLRPRPTEETESLPVGLVFRSVGYRGVSLPDIPFHDRWGTINNKEGRIIGAETEQPLTGLYTAGWIKRGPSGVIGTNKPDAVETVKHMLADLEQGAILKPEAPSVDAAAKFIQDRQPDFVSYEDWLRVDEVEVNRGQEQGRPRVKFTNTEEMLALTEKLKV
ncbi:MAG: FAD-dependent oxidoreductase [Chloroflexota bacterium]